MGWDVKMVFPTTRYAVGNSAVCVVRLYTGFLKSADGLEVVSVRDARMNGTSGL